MAAQNTDADRTELTIQKPTPTGEGDRGILQRWREWSDDRKRLRLARARNRRALAQWLRRTADGSHDTDPIRGRRHETLLHYRAAAVRTELLEMAALLEHAHNPDPACVTALHDLLANESDSPLYNADISASELRATLDYARSGLLAHPRAQPTAHKEDTMELYAILRRDGWRSGEELEQAAARSTKVGNNEMADGVRWIRSYVLDEGVGAVGTVCIYEATSPEAIRRHASLADLPVDEIIRVADTVVVRPDPQPATA